MAYPEHLKNELVLCFKYKRLFGVWSRAGDQPAVIRVATEDCSQACRDPQLVGSISDGFVEVRIYDEQGIDIANESTLLGDWRNAEKRCEDCLQAEVKKLPGYESDCVQQPSQSLRGTLGLHKRMQVHGVLETAINVADLATAREFYQRLFSFEVLEEDERLCALDVGGQSVLLLFQKGASKTPTVVPGGTIPHHDGDCPTHFALSIAAEDVPAWEDRLTAEHVAIESRVNWPKGGRSIYFRDADDNLVELATPGLWAIY